ncbi:hypothetical protein M514_17660, partial [Trichuris suis]
WKFQPSTIASMKKFDGYPEGWPAFIATFKTLVHDLLPSDVQRLAVLGRIAVSQTAKRYRRLFGRSKYVLRTVAAASSHLRRSARVTELSATLACRQLCLGFC